MALKFSGLFTEASQNARVHQGASIAVFLSKIVWLDVKGVELTGTEFVTRVRDAD